MAVRASVASNSKKFTVLEYVRVYVCTVYTRADVAMAEDYVRVPFVCSPTRTPYEPVPRYLTFLFPFLSDRSRNWPTPSTLNRSLCLHSFFPYFQFLSIYAK